MNSDVLNWKCLIRVTVSQTRFDTTKSQAPLLWFVDGFGAVCLSNLFVWVFWQISLHLEVMTRFDTTKSQAPLRWFVDGFGAVCLSNLFVWVFWQISLHLEVLSKLHADKNCNFCNFQTPNSKIQRFKDSKVERSSLNRSPQIQRFKDSKIQSWKEVLWIEAPKISKIQRFKDSKVEKKFFESKPQNQIQRFKDSKVEKKFFESKPQTPSERFKELLFNLWIFESLNLGFGASIQRTSFQPLNLWIWGLGLRFKELLFNLWIFESLNFGGFDSKNFFSTFESLNLWIFEFGVWKLQKLQFFSVCNLPEYPNYLTT